MNNTESHRSLESTDYHYLDLKVAVLEQAFDDYRSLVRSGIIKDGKYSGEWPRSKGRTVRYGSGAYRAECEVIDLLHFLRTENLQEWLDECGVKVTALDIHRELGIAS